MIGLAFIVVGVIIIRLALDLRKGGRLTLAEFVISLGIALVVLAVGVLKVAR